MKHRDYIPLQREAIFQCHDSEHAYNHSSTAMDIIMDTLCYLYGVQVTLNYFRIKALITSTFGYYYLHFAHINIKKQLKIESMKNTKKSRICGKEDKL